MRETLIGRVAAEEKILQECGKRSNRTTSSKSRARSPNRNRSRRGLAIQVWHKEITKDCYISKYDRLAVSIRRKTQAIPRCAVAINLAETFEPRPELPEGLDNGLLWRDDALVGTILDSVLTSR